MIDHKKQQAVKQQLAQAVSPNEVQASQDEAMLSAPQDLRAKSQPKSVDQVDYPSRLETALIDVNNAFEQVAEQQAAASEAGEATLSVEQLTPLMSDTFFNAVKEVQRCESGHEHFTRIKNTYSNIKGLSLAEFNKATKIRKSEKKATKQAESSDEPALASGGDIGVLVDLIQTEAVLFHDEDEETYITIRVPELDKSTEEQKEGHWQTLPIDSGKKSNFAALIYKKYKTLFGSVISENALKSVVQQCSAIALYDGQCLPVYRRVAHDVDNQRIYIDLGNDQWEMVAIDSQGWQIIPSSECQAVRFVRAKQQRPLVKPKVGGIIDLLWKHLNISQAHARYLILAWLLECLRLQTHYPVLEISGGQGTAKSTLQERLRDLIDPNMAKLRGEPREVRDIYVAAHNSYVVSFNNVSYLTDKKQDALCNVSTGGGDATRSLYSNHEEHVIEVKRPVIMNGIPELATRSDLGDRVIAVRPDAITDKQRQSDIVLKERWENDLPAILGALYNLMVGVLKELPNVEQAQTERARLADYTALGQAMLNVMGIEDSFYHIYKANRDSVIERTLESSPLAQALVKLIDDKLHYKGAKGQLLEVLVNDYLPTHYDKSAFPKSARGLGDALRRLAPALLVRGIEITENKERRKDGYYVEIKKLAASSERKSITL
jgi:hypothetical protein